MKKLFQGLILVLSTAMIIWVVTSYIEVISHNLDGMSGEPYTYSSTNLFKVMERVGNAYLQK